MISHFLCSLTDVASVRHPPSPPSKLVLCQYLSPSCLPSKNANSYRGLRVPHYTMRERFCSLTCQSEVIRLNWKDSILGPQPDHVINGTRSNEVVMQPPKKRINILHLPIIELSNKPWTPTTTISNIYYRSILRRSNRIRAQECIPQQYFPTPPIITDLHLSPWPNLKPCFNFECLPTISDCLPSYTKPPSHLLCAPCPFLNPILTNNYPFPKRIPFLNKSPRPFPQQGLIEKR